MKLRNIIILGIALAVTAGCTRNPQSSREGPKGEKLEVAVTKERFPITQEESKKFSVTVTREKLSGPVQVDFDLPEGLKVKESKAEWTFNEGTKQKFFTLYAEKNAKPQKEARVRITAKHEALASVADILKVEIVESLESKKERQNAFAKAMDNKLLEIKQELKVAGKTIMDDIKDPGKKSTYLKRMGELYKTLDDARKKYDDLTAAPVETWERNKQAVESAVTDLKQAVERFHNDIKKT